MNYEGIVNSIVSFILVLYGDPALPRKVVQIIIDFISNFTQEVLLASLKNDILLLLEKEKLSEITLSEIDTCFKTYSSSFDDFSSEAKRFALLKKKGFIDPEEFTIGNTFVEKLIQNEIKWAPDYIYGMYVPLRKTLKLFLEVPGIFKTIMEYITNLRKETCIISNIMQGKLWLSKYDKNFDDIVLPLYIFYDDLETGNALGSHAGTNKFGAVYTCLACLPPKIASKLSSIIFTLLVHTEDKKRTTNEKVFQKLINELNFLQATGININIEGKIYLIKFQLVLILSDNLGLNGILGFVESFKSNYFCRICKVSQKIASTLSVEDQSLLRTRQNYSVDCTTANPSHTGVKEPCVFNQVNDFHVVENLSIDMMHDILEGVCVYDLQAIICEFIFKKKYFTLELLNCRIQDFDYGIEGGNIPPALSLHRLKNCKLHIKMSAAEMLCFVRYLGLIIGDLIPEEDTCWQLYKYLRQILDIVTSPRIVKSDAQALTTVIENHNQLFVNLFESLKPKFHFLIHYPRILLENGPCIHFWSMRFESRHRQLKSNVHATSCTKNLLKTISIKQNLKMCQMFHTLECEKDIQFGSEISNPNCTFLTQSNTSASKTQYSNKCVINNTLYETDYFLVTNLEEIEKEFGKIIQIVKIDTEIFFLVEIYKEISFSDHYHAYIVQNTKQRKMFNVSDLPNITLFVCQFLKMQNISLQQSMDCRFK